MITSSVDKFVANLKDGLASPNRYWVEFSFPNFESDNFNLPLGIFDENPAGIMSEYNSQGQLSMMMTTIQLPSRAINTHEHKHQNYPISIPYSQSYSPVTFGYTLSSDLRERRFFELWQNVIVNVSNGTMNFYNEYVSDIKIHTLDKQNNSSYTIILKECFPTSLSDIQLSYAANNETMNGSVTISYKYWINADS